MAGMVTAQIKKHTNTEKTMSMIKYCRLIILILCELCKCVNLKKAKYWKLGRHRLPIIDLKDFIP